MQEPSAHSVEQNSSAYLHSCCRFLQNIGMKPHGITCLNLPVLATVTSTLAMHITTYTTHCSAHLTALMVLLHSHHRLKDNITMAFSDTMGGNGLDWSGSGYKQVVYCFKQCTGHIGSMKYKFLDSSKIYWLLQTASALCHWLVAYLVIYVFSQCGNIPSKDITFMNTKR